MPRLSHAQTDVWQRINALAMMELGPNRLATGIADALQLAVPGDGYRFFRIDPQTLLVNRLLAASENDDDARTEWLREVYLAAEPLDYLELPTLLRANLRAVAFQDRQEQCWGYPRRMLSLVDEQDHYSLFHDFRSPVGGTVLVTLKTEEQSIGAIQWYRRDPKRPFRAGDVAFIGQIVPVIAKALATAIAREKALLTDSRKRQGFLSSAATGRSSSEPLPANDGRQF